MDDAVVTATSGQIYRQASCFWPVDVIGGVQTEGGTRSKIGTMNTRLSGNMAEASEEEGEVAVGG